LFTAVSPGTGTGLELSIVQGLVQRHGSLGQARRFFRKEDHKGPAAVGIRDMIFRLAGIHNLGQVLPRS
jgi:hypothetical protein